MCFTAVESTTLATVAYDEARQLLQLEFRNRAVDHYFGAPATVQEILRGAPSRGGYFNQAIRGRYAFVRVPSIETSKPAGVSPQCERGEAPWHAR